MKGRNRSPILAPPGIMPAVMAVEEALDAPWTVERMAATTGLSPSRFAHFFRDAVGESPVEYVTRLRLERAALHLMHSNWPVTEVAMVAGYDSHAGFTHAFTARFGCSPTAFREKRRRMSILRDFGRTRGWMALKRDRPSHSRLRVEVVRQAPFRLAFVRQWGRMTPVPRAWVVLVEWARSRGLVGPNAQPVGCNYDDDAITPSDRRRYDAGIVVGPDFDAQGEVALRDVPGGLVARTRFRGSVLGLVRTWDRFVLDWLPGSGFQPRTIFAYDIYPSALLSDGFATTLRLTVAVRSTLCIPVLPLSAEPAEAWAGCGSDDLPPPGEGAATTDAE